jgi:hypothetical protein
VVGGVIALRFGRLQAWPIATAGVLWFSFGGHWIELWFLNWLRPRLSPSRVAQIAARIAVWFVGGIGLGIGIAATMQLSRFTRGVDLPPWWVAGLAFIAVEFVAHLPLAVRGRPNFYSGNG